jgi:hypothetical protein
MGGSFANGAQTAAYGFLFNSALHDMQSGAGYGEGRLSKITAQNDPDAWDPKYNARIKGYDADGTELFNVRGTIAPDQNRYPGSNTLSEQELVWTAKEGLNTWSPKHPSLWIGDALGTDIAGNNVKMSLVWVHRRWETMNGSAGCVTIHPADYFKEIAPIFKATYGYSGTITIKK